MAETSKCLLLENTKDLEKSIKSHEKIFILFYASWCPYSQRFLPEFTSCSNTCSVPTARIVIDDEEDLVDKYSIEVYPTVLYFEGGKLVKRLDGSSHEGLTKDQYEKFIDVCVRKGKQ